MSRFIKTTEKPVKLTLSRDISKHLKQGHPWVFQDALKTLPVSTPGSMANLYGIKNDLIARGFYHPDIALKFRVCLLGHEKESLGDDWFVKKVRLAIRHRESFFGSDTTAFRLICGEGDGLPGFIADLYHDQLVIQFDGEGPKGFYLTKNLGQLFQEELAPFLKLGAVYLKYKSGKDRHLQEEKGEVLWGDFREETQFLENGVKFATNLREGAKTGFFLDQRDHRLLISKFSKNQTVLNLFGYTGGFSLFAGLGGARQVTTVDLAPRAVAYADKNWRLNFKNSHHQGLVADAFEFCEKMIQEKQKFDVVITDPPSFAPSKDALTKAMGAYEKMFTLSVGLVAPGGLFAASSCSAHLREKEFEDICRRAISHNKRVGTLVYQGHQPFDHPYPFACEELKYLKFYLFRLD